MPSATAAALRQRLQEAFPPGRPYRRADLAADPMPAPVAHYLEHLLDERLRRHAQHALRGPFDADSPAVRAVRAAFLRALYTAAQFHADEWEAALSEAVDRSVAYLLRPARVLAAVVFERQRGTLPLSAVLKRMERFAGHEYFVEGVSNYAAEPDTEPEIDDNGFAKLLVQIDTYVAERRSARGWVESVRPFFALGRLLPDDPGLVSRLLETFFDPRLPIVAERLSDERYGIDETRLFALLVECGLSPEPLGDEPFAAEEEQTGDEQGAALRFELAEDFEDDASVLDREAPEEEEPAEAPAPAEMPDAAPLPYPIASPVEREASLPGRVVELEKRVETDKPKTDGPEAKEREAEEPEKTDEPVRPALALVPPTQSPSSESASEEPTPEDEEVHAASAEPVLEDATPADAEEALKGDAVPLWQRFAKEPGSKAPLPTAPPAAPASPSEPPPVSAEASGAVWPAHARPADASKPKDKPAPLWKQFVQPKNAPAQDLASASTPSERAPEKAKQTRSPESATAAPLPAAAAALASPAAPPASRALDDLEGDVLGPKAAKKRRWFVRELFGDDPVAYAYVLRRLDGTESWDEAWKVIGGEVFRKHKVNIYGPAAVAFTDAVEARHKARAAGA